MHPALLPARRFAFSNLFLLLLAAGCSTQEVYSPQSGSSGSTPVSVSREERSAIVRSEGVRIEATVARESPDELRVDLVIDNASDRTLEIFLGETHLIYNGQDLKPTGSRFLRNWSYQRTNRALFAPNESAYASVSYARAPLSTGSETIEVRVDGIQDHATDRPIAMPTIRFANPVRTERPESASTSAPAAHKTR
ncbi:MAG: hypothetical protein JO317_08480 [Verrucomicrobiae bacterium]|nr:hypothetical protein [Verrucomicrobiae bacterium]